MADIGYKLVDNSGKKTQDKPKMNGKQIIIQRRN